MRRLLLVLILAFAAFAQESGSVPGKEESFAERHELELKWANFLLLAGALGYLIRKHGGPFFAARSAAIRKDLDESERQRKDAEARAAEVDAHLARLDQEIAVLRAQSQAEGKTESERMTQHAAAEIAKIQAGAEYEIASAGKAARTELKRYAAQLAVDLAEKKIRARMTPETQSTLVRSFVHDLK